MQSQWIGLVMENSKNYLSIKVYTFFNILYCLCFGFFFFSFLKLKRHGLICWCKKVYQHLFMFSQIPWDIIRFCLIFTNFFFFKCVFNYLLFSYCLSIHIFIFIWLLFFMLLLSFLSIKTMMQIIFSVVCTY